MINFTIIRSISAFVIVSLIFSKALAQKLPLYIGTYTTGGDSEGVYQYLFDDKTGASTLVKTIKQSNPSFLARKGARLYIVNENTEGAVSVVNLKDGSLLNALPTQGAHPCHVSLSPDRPLAVVSNYSGGSLNLFSLNSDGSLSESEDFLTYNGASINQARQSASHIHSAFFQPKTNRLFVSDLGADLVYVYDIRQIGGKYKLDKVGELPVKKGGGPRHVAFSKDGKVVYVVLELTGELEVFKQVEGDWSSQQTLKLYKSGFEGEQGAADIKLSPDGKFIYASNRGQANTICCFKIMKDGLLELKQIESVFGDSPRNIQISPSGKWLFTTNQLSNQITIFKRSKATGLLTKTENSIVVSKPVCLIF